MTKKKNMQSGITVKTTNLFCSDKLLEWLNHEKALLISTIYQTYSIDFLHRFHFKGTKLRNEKPIPTSPLPFQNPQLTWIVHDVSFLMRYQSVNFTLFQELETQVVRVKEAVYSHEDIESISLSDMFKLPQDKIENGKLQEMGQSQM